MKINLSTRLKGIDYIFRFILLYLFNLGSPAFAQWSGTGTSSDPFLINNVTDLTTLATNVNNGTSTYSSRFFKLTTNLNLNGNPWTPIGTSSSRLFQGNFDGNNHIISGLTINLSSTDNIGLFGFANGTIRNLGVETTSVGVTGRSATAILLGSQNGGSITNCYVMGKVSTTDTGGGLVGNMVASSSSINGCYAFVQITGSANTNGLGGLVGVQRGNITNSYTFGSVQGSGNAGGITGTGSTSAVLSNSYSASSVKSNTPARIGGLTGNQSQTSALLKNSVAINDSVISVPVSTAVGRVLGFRNNINSALNNYAWDKMPVKVNNLSKSVNPNGNNIDGASQTLSNLKSYPFYSTTISWENTISTGNSGSAVWNIWDDNSYPYLQTQSSPVNNVSISGTTLQGIFRPDVAMDSISIYVKNETIFTRLGIANVNNTGHTWTYSDPALNINGILYIFAYETGKNWPSYPISYIVCSLPPTFDVIDGISCTSALNLQSCITNLQNAGINDVQFSKANGSAFDENIILSPTTYSVNNVQTIYARVTSNFGCQSSIKSFQVKQTGSLLFKEDFGNNSDPGGTCSSIPLNSNVTSYIFGGNLFTNGHYNMCSQLSDFYSDYWYYDATAYDHTDPGRGRSLIVNADIDPGRFYTLKIDNICPGSHLYFSAWVFNLINPNAPNTIFYGPNTFNDPNLLFVLTSEDGNTLTTYNTGSIPKVTDSAKNWRPYGFEFVAGSSSSITLTLYNNAPGGNGNDLMIDDIEVYLCAPPITIEGQSSYYCPGETANLTVKNQDGTPIDPSLKVNWLFSTTDEINSTTQWTLIPGQTTDHLSITIQEAGYLRAVVGSAASIDAGLYNCCSNSDPIRIVSTPDLMYWKQNAVDNNWNNPLNWVDANGVDLNIIPGLCSDVHIPGNANYYPSLDSISTERTSTYGDPVCRDITFHFGAEVAKQHHLTYRKAYVQYNFGYYNGSTYMTDGDPYSATPMTRGRWYALAAPLKKIVSGDFSVGGFPNTWQQGFKSSPDHTSTLSGNWYNPESTVALEIGARQNYAISIWAGEYLQGVLGEDDHTNLNELKGIFQMPYFEDALINSKHRIHTYMPADSTSRFNYYYYNRTGLPIEPSQYDDFPRASESYRFVIEGNDKKPLRDFSFPVPAGTDIMVGNPFVSSIDFEDFYSHNNSAIENYYRLFVNDNFETYSLDTGSPEGLTNYISSFQGFFLTTKGSGTVNLHFPVSSSVTRPGFTSHMLRSASNAVNDIIRIKVSDKKSNSWVTLVLNAIKPGADVQQLFIVNNDSRNVPQTYLLNTSKLKNVIQYESGNNIEVPVGIMSQSADSMKITVVISEENYYNSLTLVDNLLKTETNLLEKNTYSFKNEPTIGERFLLRINNLNVPTGIDPHENNDLFDAYIKNNLLQVRASEKISEIEMLTIQGVRLYSWDAVDTDNFTKSIRVPQGVYIVRAKLESNEWKNRKVIAH